MAKRFKNSISKQGSMKGHWASKCCDNTFLYGSHHLKAT
jgi:hypothetical protein